MSAIPRILIVEDEAILYENIYSFLTSKGYAVEEYTPSYQDAIKIIEKQKPDLALLDIQLQGEKTGLDLGKILKEIYHIPFIYITELDSEVIFEKALQTEHEDFIVKTKPVFNENELLRAIKTVLKRHGSAQKQFHSNHKIGIEGLVDYSNRIKNYPLGKIGRKVIPFDKISYFTTRGFINEKGFEEPLKPNYIRFETIEKNNYFLPRSLNKLETILPEFFVRISDSYIVNIAYPHLQGRINGRNIVINNISLTISSKYFKSFREKYNNFYEEA